MDILEIQRRTAALEQRARSFGFNSAFATLVVWGRRMSQGGPFQARVGGGVSLDGWGDSAETAFDAVEARLAELDPAVVNRTIGVEAL